MYVIYEKPTTKVIKRSLVDCWCVFFGCEVTITCLINTCPQTAGLNPLTGPQCLLHIACGAHLQCKSSNTIHNLRFNIDACKPSFAHTKMNQGYRFNLHRGRRKNSLQQWAGVTINTLMISRDRREKASGGGRRNPFHNFKSNPPLKHLETTSQYEMAQSHTGTIIIWIHSTGLVLVQKMFFVTQHGETLSPCETTDAHGGRARTELVLLGTRAGSRGEGGRVRLVRFYENISWVMPHARVMPASASA